MVLCRWWDYFWMLGEHCSYALSSLLMMTVLGGPHLILGS
jgi:hypothetical protein